MNARHLDVAARVDHRVDALDVDRDVAPGLDVGPVEEVGVEGSAAGELRLAPAVDAALDAEIAAGVDDGHSHRALDHHVLGGLDLEVVGDIAADHDRAPEVDVADLEVQVALHLEEVADREHAFHQPRAALVQRHQALRVDRVGPHVVARRHWRRRDRQRLPEDVAPRVGRRGQPTEPLPGADVGKGGHLVEVHRLAAAVVCVVLRPERDRPGDGGPGRGCGAVADRLDALLAPGEQLLDLGREQLQVGLAEGQPGGADELHRGLCGHPRSALRAGEVHLGGELVGADQQLKRVARPLPSLVGRSRRFVSGHGERLRRWTERRNFPSVTTRKRGARSGYSRVKTPSPVVVSTTSPSRAVDQMRSLAGVAFQCDPWPTAGPQTAAPSNA